MKNTLRMAGCATALMFAAPAFAAPEAPVVLAPDVQATDEGQTDDLSLDALIAPKAAEPAPLPIEVPHIFAPQIADAATLAEPVIAAPAGPMAPAPAVITEAELPGDIAPAITASVPLEASAAPVAAAPTLVAAAPAAPVIGPVEAPPSSVLKTLDGKPWSPVIRPAAIADANSADAAGVSEADPMVAIQTPPAILQTAAPAPQAVAAVPVAPAAAPEAPVQITIEASVASDPKAAPVIIPVTVPAAAPAAPLAATAAVVAPKPVRPSLAPRGGLPIETEAPEATLQDAAFTANAADMAPVDWRTLISPGDKERLSKLAATRRAAIKQAEAAIDSGNKAAIVAAPSTSGLIYATPMIAADADLVGEFRCRTTSLGGPAPKLVLYKYATCRIVQWPNGTLVIEKTSGTDRFIGRLWREPDSSYIYLGANFPEEGAVWAYNESPAQNQVGRLYRIGANRLRLELPKPNASTGLNVVDFTRQK